ncbi:hypothetical protein Bca4012_090775 [Brassica carinata]
MSLSPSSREINLASSSILDQSIAALEFHHLISSFYSEISSHLISLLSKRRRLEEKARIEGRMKLRQHARLAVRVSLLLIHYGINTNVRNGFTIIKTSVFYFRKQQCSLQNLLNSQQPNTSFSFLNREPSIEVTSSDAKWAEDDTEDEHTVSDRKERRKWSPTEDIALISAWLNTSKDPVVGMSRKQSCFGNGLQAILHPVQRLLVCKREGQHNVNKARKKKSSGQSEDDVLKMAHEIFFKVKFTLEHAWLELRHDQKWCGASETKDKVSSKRRKLNDQSQQSASSVPGCDGEDEASARPIGVKAAKGKGKSKAKTSDKAVEFQGIWEIKQRDFELKEKLNKQKLLDSLIAKTELLDELEISLKNKLITDMEENSITFEASQEKSSGSTSSTRSPAKCTLLDCNNSGRKVAEGRVASTDPNELCHFVPLGPNASKVWIDVAKIGDAKVWRPNSEIEYISDAMGSVVA